MNVTCTGCPAKYAVPDEKVRGKKVRITCKHCGTNLVVDGTSLGGEASVLPKAPEPAAAPAAAPVVAAPAPAPVVESSYLVGFSDDRQETHPLSQIVSLYASGTLDDEALVWKDGMTDWVSPFDVPEISSAMLKRGVTRRVPQRLPSFSAPADEEATLIARSPFDLASALPDSSLEPPAPAPVVAPAPVAAPAPIASPAIAHLRPAAQPAAVKPAAARRPEQRGAVDLFGSVGSAGSEGDVSLDLAAPEEPAHKLTGARNESSVLFSLDALTKPDPKAAKAKASSKAKEDDNASALLFGDSAPNSLMNISGGGLGTLAAPDFSKPISPGTEPLPVAAPAVAPVRISDVPSARSGNKGGLALILISVVSIGAVAGVALFMMNKQSAAEKAPEPAKLEEPNAAAPPPSAEAPASSAAATPAANDSAVAVAAGGAAPTSPTEGSAGMSASATATQIANAKLAAAANAKAAAAAAADPAGAVKPEASPATPPAATPAPAPAPATEGAAFDKNAAVAALGAAAANAASCKKPDGPTGTGKASVTFAPSGRATVANVSGVFAGTEVGGCVARLFRSAKVPPFGGDPVTVSKSFSID